MSEPGKNRDQITIIMSSAKRDRSPSVEVHDPDSPDEQNPEEDECTESEQELSTSQNEPQSRQTSSRNVNETTVCWKFFAVPPKGISMLKNIIMLAQFSCTNCDFLGLNFGHFQGNERQNRTEIYGS